MPSRAHLRPIQVQDAEDAGGDIDSLLLRNEKLLQCAPALAHMCVHVEVDASEALTPESAQQCFNTQVRCDFVCLLAVRPSHDTIL